MLVHIQVVVLGESLHVTVGIYDTIYLTCSRWVIKYDTIDY